MASRNGNQRGSVKLDRPVSALRASSSFKSGLPQTRTPSSNGRRGSGTKDFYDSVPGRVRVAVRLRPQNPEELVEDADFAECVELQPELKRLKLRKNNWDSDTFEFDEVLTEFASQKRVYEVVAKPVVESVLEGYNGTVMAYGQTGTGKTFTLGRLGDEDTSARGIMVRAMEDILANISLDTDSIKISYLQLYMETVQDLLNPANDNISIVEDPKTGDVSVPAATVVEIRSHHGFMELLRLGEAHRVAANTKLNTESSRSHAILMTAIVTKDLSGDEWSKLLDAGDASPTGLLSITEETLTEFLSKATGTDVEWVQMPGMKIAAKFLKANKITVDLVGNEKMKASESIRHIVMPCSSSARSQCEPPREVEAYIHRSGRTGRAGNTGVAVMLYEPRKSNISKLERESGVKFEHISAPQLSDIAKAAGLEAAEAITQVSDSVIPVFTSAAEELLRSSGLTPVELLAKALAMTTGYFEIKTRSLLSSMENYVTVLLETGRPIYSPSYVYGVLRRFLPEEKVESIMGLALTADQKGAVFDVAAEDLDLFLTGQENAAGVSLDVVKELPHLQEREQSRGRFGGGGYGGDRRGSGSGSRFGRGGGGRFSSGGGRGGRGTYKK